MVVLADESLSVTRILPAGAGLVRTTEQTLDEPDVTLDGLH